MKQEKSEKFLAAFDKCQLKMVDVEHAWKMRNEKTRKRKKKRKSNTSNWQNESKQAP